MKALHIDGPDRLTLLETSNPKCENGECLVAVRLAGICRTDLELLKGYMGFTGIPGHEFAGTVKEGPESLLNRRVVGEINVPGLGQPLPENGDARHLENRTVLGILNRDGAFAEYLALPASNLFIVPDSVSDEQAVFTEPLAAALEILEQIHLAPGTSVLVIGDGKLGLLIAQVLALHGGAVTLLGHHEKKLALANGWGVRTVLNNASELPDEFHRRLPLVVEATGSPCGFRQALEAVRPRGTIILKSTYAPQDPPTFDSAKIVVDEITLIGSRCGRFAPALDLLAQGKVDIKSLIDHRLTLDEGVRGFELAAQSGVLKVLLSV